MGQLRQFCIVAALAIATSVLFALFGRGWMLALSIVSVVLCLLVACAPVLRDYARRTSVR